MFFNNCLIFNIECQKYFDMCHSIHLLLFTLAIVKRQIDEAHRKQTLRWFSGTGV